jgi:hypothetical protein
MKRRMRTFFIGPGRQGEAEDLVGQLPIEYGKRAGKRLQGTALGLHMGYTVESLCRESCLQADVAQVAAQVATVAELCVGVLPGCARHLLQQVLQHLSSPQSVYTTAHN